MRKEAQQYSGFEREQVFVPRYALPPDADSGLWRYCLQRHRSFWSEHGEAGRRVPFFQDEGKVGWWFPRIWVEEFAASGRLVRPAA